MNLSKATVRLASALVLLGGLGVFAGLQSRTWAQQSKSTEDQVKAAYLYNFGRYVKWPPNAALDQQRSFAICVFNQDPLGAALDGALSGETLNGKPVTVKHVASAQDISGCRILFINAVQSKNLRDVLAALDQSSVLTVSDMPDFLQHGGMIQFVPERENIRFKVNLANVQSAKLSLSSELLKVAAAVQGNTRPGGA